MTSAPESDHQHPRLTEKIFGHAEAERLLLADWTRDKLPGAYLFAGPKGIGKASTAYRFACFLLATPMPSEQSGGLFGEALPPIAPDSLAVDADHPTARRIASGGHMNVLAIERSVDEKSKKLRNEIVVDDVRKIGNFLSKSAGEDGWRIVIIDAADEMNNNAANAVLKWLEEPPERAIFLLIASHPGALLPTIRSRCRTINFRPASPETFARILQRSSTLEAEEIEELYFLSGGAPGWALTLHESGMTDMFEELLELYASGASASQLDQFAESLAAGRKKERAFSDVAALLLSVLAGIVRAAAGTQKDASLKEQQVFNILAAKKPLDYWLDLWEKCPPLLADTERVHLDSRLIIAGILSAMAGKESMLYYMKSGH